MTRVRHMETEALLALLLRPLIGPLYATLRRELRRRAEH